MTSRAKATRYSAAFDSSADPLRAKPPPHRSDERSQRAPTRCLDRGDGRADPGIVGRQDAHGTKVPVADGARPS